MRILIACVFLLCAVPGRTEQFTTDAYLKRAFDLAPEVASSKQAYQASQAQWKQSMTDAWLPALTASANENPWGYNPLNSNVWNSWNTDATSVNYSIGAALNIFNSFYD